MSQLPTLFDGRISLLLRWVIALLGLLVAVVAFRSVVGEVLMVVAVAGIVCLKLGEKSKRLGWVGTGLSGLLIAPFICVLFLSPFFGPRQARAEAISQLKTAKSEAELRAAIGNLGLFLESTNGWWIAIRYRDSHAGGIWSVAVAKDSGGQLHESTHHFCGTLRAFAHDWESYSRDLKEASERPNRQDRSQLEDEWEKFQVDRMKNSFPELFQLAQATNLADARDQLHKAWFKRIDQP